ncbi:uncharacterized protein BXZ73DRAFT_34439, partial [Epithele typhae]|uniref:uncharacterized protein n=1 Tax=Epithele typhae TaxID=378194 RepID=UPI002007C65C
NNTTTTRSCLLSTEGLESEPFELKTDDIAESLPRCNRCASPASCLTLEFCINIIGKDNKTIVHCKIAARVVCVFTEIDVQ